MEEFNTRVMEEGDLNFVLSTWLKSYRVDAKEDLVNPVVSRIPGRTYFKGQEAAIKKILKNASVLVACDKDDPSFITGYFVFESTKLHYLYVKGTFRNRGIARKLLDQSGLDLTHPFEFTHHTPDIFWIKRKLPLLHYNPYLEETA